MSLQDKIHKLIIQLNTREAAHDDIMEHKISKWVSLEPKYNDDTKNMRYYRQCLNCKGDQI